jgi:spore coat polysaccharide biosynthesis protein SpsF
VIASIEARMAASRLPGKVMTNLHGGHSLARMTERLRDATSLDGLIIATSDGADDDAIARWAEGSGVAVYRGSEVDVLDRVRQAQRRLRADVVVELCGDCPLIDPELVDLAVWTFLNNDCDIVSTTRVASYPQGFDVEVFRLADLEEVADSVTDPAVREHVSLYFYEHPDRYRLINLLAPTPLKAPKLRCQLDYPEDQAFLEALLAELEPVKGRYFSLGDVVELLRDRPELSVINAHCEEKAARE